MIFLQWSIFQKIEISIENWEMPKKNFFGIDLVWGSNWILCNLVIRRGYLLDAESNSVIYSWNNSWKEPVVVRQLPHASWYSTNKLISVFNINLIVLLLVGFVFIVIAIGVVLVWLHFVISFLVDLRTPGFRQLRIMQYIYIYAWNRLIAIQGI